MSKELERAVAAHYSRPNLEDAIIDGLKRSGTPLDRINPQDVAPVDEFHTAGRLATMKALKLFPLEKDMHVLDAGSGIGGTARVLAAECECRVTGLDLTPDYVETARRLTERMGLSDRCRFETGSVVDMPFGDAEFDAALTFHVAMNIADRSAFYGELARTMRPGAPLCIFDVMDGPGAGMRYPVPWAETHETSFLKSRDETVSLLEAAGFTLVEEENLREFAIGFFQDVFARAAEADGPPPLGLHLLTGGNAPEKFSNYAKALDDHQIEPVILVARRS
ncbi:class I SAM-dependent methyltransferase [Hoeflea poritis]|uniref:Class I SAM-dependent methyltransferase n=1 Tax=Hoeflea poritis TaxID=2993659 RepID=A0ABT4VLH9_9HYPH|nr:class I SAM-dependent methyltransferase [Hoeflea poritis]MDA4845554.1 class I SAM-dependent methyltransferase [Hoeflea poritis]